MKRWLVALAVAAALPARAGELPSLGALTQGEFRLLAEDLGAAFSYKGVTPATPLGLAGFDVGVEASVTDIRHTGLFNLAGNGVDTVTVPKVHVHKGLPFGIDIGAFVGSATGVSASLYGLEARYAMAGDGIVTPAVALRVAGTRTSDIGGLKLDTLSGDLVVSKRLTLVTPYAGAGVVRTTASAESLGLSEERLNKSRVFAGLNVNLALVNLAVEAEKLGGNTTLSAKAGWRF